MEQAMARLQEIQCTVAGGSKVCGGVVLSPRSTRGYLRTSLRCKEETLRMRELAMKVAGESNLDEGGHCERTSGSARFYGELRRSSSMGEWRRWSMPAVLIQQSVGEILEASNAAKEAAYLISNSIENKRMEFPEMPQSSLNGKHPYLQGNQGSDCRHVLDNIKMPQLDAGRKAWLQKSSSTKPGKIICKIRMMVKDASSTLKNRRKAEKQELSARAGAELPQAGIQVRRKMSFNASDQAKEPARSEETLSSKSVSHCYSPSGTVDQDTCSSNTLIKVGQIKSAHKSWISHVRSAKAILFPNPAFVSSPWNHWNKSPKLRSMGSSMRSNLLSSVEDLPSSRTIEPSSLKEKEPDACNEETILKLIKSSSFSEAYEPNASKLIRQSSMSLALDRTMKQSHDMNASATSIANGNPQSTSMNHKVSLKLDNISSPTKVKSPKHILSSKHQDGLSTMHSITGCSLPATNKISRVSEQAVEFLPQPVSSRWPSRNRSNYNLINPKSRPKAEHMVSKSVVLRGEAVEENLDGMLCERIQKNTQLQITETDNKGKSTLMENYSFGSSALKSVAMSVNEMPYQDGILERSCSLRYPKERLLRPIDINCDVNIFGKSNSNIDASKEKCTKDPLHKKNKSNSKEKENNVVAKKSNSFLQRSWSLRHDNITLIDDGKHNNKSEGNLSFLKHVKGWMSLQRPSSNLHR